MRTPIYILMLAAACSCTPHRTAIRTGDLIFQVGENTPMTDAINAATGNEGALNFSHVGILLHHPLADSVLEATTDGGVRIVSIRRFLDRATRAEGQVTAVAMRLRDTTGVAEAVLRARKFIGQPYDYSFLPGNGKLYCSELVWESYLTHDGQHRFPAQPMNFRAADGSMPEFWVQLFDKAGEAIPQGVPGTNPNDMAKHPELIEVARFFRTDRQTDRQTDR